ncbi:hypothetical protein ASPFODRAFT_133546 [Aspergillus luchuensis CBS 106.47]|uniref:Carrier domain-containing protein n=1 Tax=Aspergillus luchuensis (strain CBS 106.47) TaxID=1137211 RepID=A0A1M3TI68_ASPLC|nr:hypothetical protein ASPFODRAFT_133546 [Aspergillus luchuensis CBS 106.47]
MDALPPALQAPVDCGRRLLPAVLDEVAITDPERVFVSVPRNPENVSAGFQDITYATFAQAVNKCAWWLRDRVGMPTDPQTILYIGPLDIRYILIIIAAAKAGHTAFFSSHRNSLDAHLSLVERSGCSVALRPKQAPAVLDQILKARSMKEVDMPELDFWFSDLDQVNPLPFTLTWEEARYKTFCILHTSGSTGIPKPVFVPYGSLASNDAHQLIPSLGGKPTLMNYLKGKRFFLALPVFHAACLTFVLAFNIFSGVTVVLPPPGPLTSDVANEVITSANLDGALLAPSLIVDLYNNPIHRQNLIKHLNLLSYVGGSLPKAVGDALSTQVKCMSIMGTCETLLFPLEMNDDPADWEYVTVSPFFGHEFQSNRDGLSELVLRRQPNHELFQGAFYTFPDKQEYRFGDLFAQHPHRPESWVFRARTDDIIAFTTAEKLNPITMESVIVASPKVKSAVIGGQGQFQASVLIEPYDYPASPAEEEQYIQEIWPYITKANRGCPAHGRIMKGFVMLTSPDKPLPRAGKDTVQRHAVFKLYAAEWQALYDRMRPHVAAPVPTSSTTTTSSSPSLLPSTPPLRPDSPTTTNKSASALTTEIEEVLHQLLPKAVETAVEKAMQGVLTRLLTGLTTGSATTAPALSPPTSPSASSASSPNTNSNIHIPKHDLKTFIHAHLAETLDQQQAWTDDSDLFQFGLDSLKVIELIAEVNRFRKQRDPNAAPVDQKLIYANPSVNQMVGVMSG